MTYHAGVIPSHAAMIHVFATITSRPDTAEATREMLRDLADASRAAAGCEHYALFQSEQDPARFQTVERWASLEAWRAHMASARVAAAITAAPALLAEMPVIHRFDRVA